MVLVHLLLHLLLLLLLLQLNASDDRGIGSVRELVKTFAETTSASFSL